MMDFKQARKLAESLAAFADPSRVLIVHLVAERGPQNVTQLTAATGLKMVNVSHHLGVLKQAGVFADAKDGRFVVYSFAPHVLELPCPGESADGLLGTVVLGDWRMTLRRGAES